LVQSLHHGRAWCQLQHCGAVAPREHGQHPPAPSQLGDPDVLSAPGLDAKGERDRAEQLEQARVEEPHRFADVWNINTSARNLVEIISNAARSDAAGDYPIRIYTIGMGELVRYQLGTMPGGETSESILMRIANDARSPDRNPAQLEGKYYFAQTEADVSAAFQSLQNQIIRLTK
jgi:hypothetical protein